MSKEDRARFKALFDQLDLNKDGHIEAKELSLALQKLELSSEKDIEQHTKVIFVVM